MTDEEKPEEETEEETPVLLRYLEGEISNTGWEVKMTKQYKTHVCFRVYCKDEDREWFKIDIKCPKKKFMRIGV